MFLILCPIKRLLEWGGTTLENMSGKNPHASRSQQHMWGVLRHPQRSMKIPYLFLASVA